MAKKRFDDDQQSELSGSTAARQAKRELAKATRGMSEEEAQAAIANSAELTELLHTSKRMRGNRTGPRPQGINDYQEQRAAFKGIDARETLWQRPEKNIDGLARKAIRTQQNLARGVDVVAAILTMQNALSDEWSFRKGDAQERVSVRAKSGHGKLRGIFAQIGGIPPLPPSALSQSGESVVLQRNGDPKDIVSIPCLSDAAMQHRGAGRQLSRQESEGIEKKIGVHPSDLVDAYQEKFSPGGIN